MADDKELQHRIVQEIKRIQVERGRLPSRREFEESSQISKNQVYKAFGSWTAALQACGGAPVVSGKLPKWQYFKPGPAPDLLKNFITLDLEALFQKYGNPEVLKMVVWPDVHVEHSDPYAINCALEHLNWYRPHLFLQMGDFLNAGGLSHWGADDTKPLRIAPEAKRGRELIGIIKGVLPTPATMWMLEGNHEDWIRQFICAGQNPQLFDELEDLGLDITLQKLLALDRFGVELFPLNRIVRLGRAAFTHGLFVGDAHAKKHLMSVKSSIFYGHTHDTQSYDTVSMEGPIYAQSLACLCNLDPQFLRGRMNNWSHAATEFEFFRDGTFHWVLRHIINGRMPVNGMVLKA